ncbi:MAG: hypothetical protein EP330_28075 [Deltaproteobacteria bacterium]|nr:MAG: hypothetical protein EP330_28075 [Deltaproteobacteria bacterium]
MKGFQAPTVIFSPGEVLAPERLTAMARQARQGCPAHRAAFEEALGLVLAALDDPEYAGERIIARGGPRPILRRVPASPGEVSGLYVTPLRGNRPPTDESG